MPQINTNKWLEASKDNSKYNQIFKILACRYSEICYDSAKSKFEIPHFFSKRYKTRLESFHIFFFNKSIAVVRAHKQGKGWEDWLKTIQKQHCSHDFQNNKQNNRINNKKKDEWNKNNKKKLSTSRNFNSTV